MSSLSDKRFLFVFYTFLFILPSCMFFGSSKVTYTKPLKPYKIDAPSGSWKKLNIESIDAVYWNDKLKTGMAFAVDCSADRRGDIRAISNRLFIGIKDRKIIEVREVIINENNPPSPPFNSPLTKGGYRGVKGGESLSPPLEKGDTGGLSDKRKVTTATAKGVIDNKNIIIKTYSIIDDECIYDFSYWTFKDNLEEDGIRDFEAFVKSLRW